MRRPYHGPVPALARDAIEGSTPRVSAGLLIVLGSAALFGMIGPLSRFAYESGLEPASFVAWRALVGLLAIGLFVAWRIRRGVVRLARPADLGRRVSALVLIAGSMGFILNLCLFVAFDRITVALALLGFYTYPALVAIVNVILGRERLDRPRAAALGLALAGMIAVVASQLDPGGAIRLDALGFGLALGAALSQTIYVVISRDGYRAVPAEQALVVVMVVTFIGGSLVAVLNGSATSLAQPLRDPGLVPLLLFAGIFSAAIPSLGFLTGIRAIGGTRAGILMLFEPVVGVALAAWLLGEALVPIQALGAAAILAAALLLQRAGQPRAGSDRGSRPVVVPGGP